MIAMVEGTQRKKTPNEIGLQIFLITLTIIFLTVSITLVPFTDFSSQLSGKGEALSLVIVIAFTNLSGANDDWGLNLFDRDCRYEPLDEGKRHCHEWSCDRSSW